MGDVWTAPALALPQFSPAAPGRDSAVLLDSGGCGFEGRMGHGSTDALPFKGKLGSCLVGGFLACVWHWVIWL